MEFELLFHFAPIFSVILLILVTIFTVFQKLKLRWPVKANCWFCNKNTKIWRQQLNWWMCPYCEQYNGFSKNGDYAYDIPEQFMVSSVENKRYCRINQDTKNNKVASSSLCNQCNINEGIKLAKLSDYIPENESNFEYEIRQFKDSLEQQYPLCTTCETTVHNALYKQSLWITQYKMLFFKHKPLATIVNNKKYSGPVCRIISTILASMVAYNMDFTYLPIGGLFFQFWTYYVTPTRKHSCDILLMFLWICMILLLPFKDTKLIKASLLNTWFSLEYVTQYHVIILLISVIGILNIMPKSQRGTFNKNMSFKKVESFAKNTVSTESCTANLINKQNFEVTITDNTNQPITNKLTPNVTKNYMPFCEENTINSKYITSKNSIVNQESQLSSANVKDNSVVFNSVTYSKKNITENHSLNDSLNSLSMLSLNEERPKLTAKTPKIFETKVYSTRSSELFKKCGKKSILSPPKLRSVTQTSWVAGGYWQEGIDVPSLSRSSSQSSGFGSMGSNFGPSREPSIHEFDQCSVMSDTTQSCYTMRQSNSPVASFYQQNIQVPLSEPKNQSISNQTLKLTSPVVCSTQTSSPVQNNKRKNSVFTDHCSQGQNMHINNIKSPSEMQMFPSHTTIVTSPVWLPALLCGSLVLNIIVLCTALLR